MKKAELVFIPPPFLSHIVPIVELARLIVDRDERFSITFLIMKFDFGPKIDSYIDSMSTACRRIRFVDLPKTVQTYTVPDPNLPMKFLSSFIEAHKPYVKEQVSKLVSNSKLGPDLPSIAGIVLDFTCFEMIDVANEYGVPSYIFFPLSAASIGLQICMQVLLDEQNVDPFEFKDSDAELVMPCLANPLPAKVLPFNLHNKESLHGFLGQVRRYRQTKGMIINTFEELESHALNSFSKSNNPPVYPIGPLLSLNRDKGDHDKSNDAYKDIKQWLDDQPQSSVVYLCFGSMGCFHVDQVREIAYGLEQNGCRFLWSLRQPPSQDKIESSNDHVNLQEILPEGFLDRTNKIGKVIGWAPQLDILAHQSVGGFVSHCGWSSLLESIWFGVPIAAWPLFGDHQLNAFEMIVELGLGVEIKMDHKLNLDGAGQNFIIAAGEIARGIRCLIELENEKRDKLKEISEKSRKALMNGGSSYTWLGRFIQDMVDNMS